MGPKYPGLMHAVVRAKPGRPIHDLKNLKRERRTGAPSNRKNKGEFMEVRLHRPRFSMGLVCETDVHMAQGALKRRPRRPQTPSRRVEGEAFPL